MLVEPNTKIVQTHFGGSVLAGRSEPNGRVEQTSVSHTRQKVTLLEQMYNNAQNCKDLRLTSESLHMVKWSMQIALVCVLVRVNRAFTSRSQSYRRAHVRS